MAFESLGQGSVADLGERYSSLEFGGQYFNPKADVKHFQPGWTSKIPLVFQILPFHTSGEWIPSYRREDGELKVTDFFMKMPEATFGSAEKMTMVLFNPFLERSMQYNARKNPYIMLRDRVRRIAHTKEGEHLKGLLSGSKGQSAALGAESTRYFYNALVWQSTQGAEIDAKGRPVGAQEGDRYPAIVSGKNSFGKAIQKILQSHIESGNPDILTGDQSMYFLGYNPETCEIGRWTSPDDRKAELDAMQAKQAEALASSLDSGGGLVDVTTSVEDDDSSYSTYKVSCLRTCVIQTKAKQEGDKVSRLLTPNRPIRDYFKLMAPRMRPVSSVLVVPSHDDQVDMIARAFADKPELLRIGFGDTEFMAHPTVQRVLKTAASAQGASGLGDSVPTGATTLMNAGTATAGLQTVGDDQLDELFGDVTGDTGQHSNARAAMRGE